MKEANTNTKVQWLRKKRNKIVHLNIETPEITVETQWFERKNLEGDAKEAIKLMFETFYISPGL